MKLFSPAPPRLASPAEPGSSMASAMAIRPAPTRGHASHWQIVLVVLGLASFVTSCTQIAETEANEQKNPHFLSGKTFVRNMDSERAIAAFEDALASNPRNASAHLELGLLYEAKHDLVSAIYHFQKHLALRPDSNNASIAKQKINSWTMEFAASVAPVLNPQTAAQVASLTAQNDQLRQENTQLRSQLSTMVARPPTNPGPRPNTNVTSPRPPENPPAGGPTPGPSPGPVAQFKEYKIKPGDNPSKIALDQGLGRNWKPIMEANPGLTEKNLRVGQIIRIPVLGGTAATRP